MRRVCQAAVTLFALRCGNAMALDAARVAAIDKAADAFVALAGDSAKTGQPPRQTDPAAKPLLDRVLNTSEVQHDVVPISELVGLSTWTLAVVEVGLVYTLAGSGMTKVELPNDPRHHRELNRDPLSSPPNRPLSRRRDLARRRTIDTVIIFFEQHRERLERDTRHHGFWKRHASIASQH